MSRLPPRSTRTDTLFPDTTLVRSPHQHQCPGHRGMKCYGIVELVLGEPRLHRDRAGLQDFRRVGADHVDAEHHVGLRLDDQLVERALLAVGAPILPRPEVGGVNLALTELVARLGQIRRAHACTLVPNAHLVSSHMLEKKTNTNNLY